jgi:enoyl-CoA hydratase
MDFQNILYQVEDNLLTITINRPDKLNALNAQTILELEAAFRLAHQESGLRGIIVTGSGEKAFVAGADISEFEGLSPEEAMQLSGRGHALLNLIEQMDIPVIAAVNGFALGGGCELALACHLRIGSEQAKLGLPEVGLGIIPGYGGTQRLVQVIGKGRALEMIMTANMIDAQTAREFGLLNHVTSQEDLLPLARKILSKIATKGPVAIKKAIKCVNAYYDKEINGFLYEIDTFGELFTTDDVVEGTRAFMEKRKPEFKGR